ncbi:MAG: MerR family transcriptional regulator, partial [Bacteroidia bacterium]|nr:MerR family transcriptional regulator [Bacteroidia bacterium]
MKNYGVKALSKLSGVSVRTLHYYDKIGLLKPSNRTEAGYRYYGEKELLRLQQILFYRELGFPLKEILNLLDAPDFDLIDALENHTLALKARQKRITKLLATIDRTIHNLKKGKIMSEPEMLYEGLPKEVGTIYRQEAIEKYGKETVEKSEKALLSLGKEGFEQLKKEAEQIAAQLFALRDENPESQK